MHCCFGQVEAWRVDYYARIPVACTGNDCMQSREKSLTTAATLLRLTLWLCCHQVVSDYLTPYDGEEKMLKAMNQPVVTYTYRMSFVPIPGAG